MRLSTLTLFCLLPGAIVHAQENYGNNKAITPERLKAHLELVASDELEGRDTPSRGLDIACLYVATQLKLWGAVPAGDNGTFFQNIKLSRSSIDFKKCEINLNGKSFAYGDGFKNASGAGSASGNMVYVGHGYFLKGKNIDPYKGLDLKGKIMIVASGMPEGTGFRDMQGTAGVDYMTPRQAAEKLGASGIITVPDADYLSNWAPRDVARMGGFTMSSDEGKSIPNITIGSELAKAIFEGESLSAEDVMKGGGAPEKSFALKSSQLIKLDVVEQREEILAKNVVAIVPGTSPTLKDEYVAFGAHIDHVGMRTSGSGDRIFNGADDDGSGTVSILEIAHAFLTGPKPKRSCLFVWHCGEEKGLWGSEYFTSHPTVPLNKIITQLNIDMIGRSKPEGDTKPSNKVLTGPHEIYVVGSTKMSTDLQKLSESTNAKFLKLTFNYKYDDPKDTENIFYRSDHYNYAKRGIPIIFYFDGVHEDYHRPGDEVSKIDFLKMSQVARTVMATGWNLANSEKGPVVDKPLKDR